MAQPAESSVSIANLASPPTTNLPSVTPATNQPIPFSPSAESPSPPPSPHRSIWSETDEERILEILRAHLRRNDDLPRGVDLLMAVFGRLTRTDYSLAEVNALRRRFEETDALLCSGAGGPAPGHDVWGAAPVAVALPKPAPAAQPNPEIPAAKNANPARPAGRPRQMAALPPPAKRMRYEEMRVQYPMLAAKVDEVTRKALEGVSDMMAWSLELRLKNQRLAGGGGPTARTDDKAKQMASLISGLI
uniref:Uncharacterized protein n=1 Tax=Leersia perrieri TaxID=77586 RepID=A0A0D9XI70_9ORYZ